MAQLGLHHRLVVGHLEERAGVRLQYDLAGPGQVLVPVAHDIPGKADAIFEGTITQQLQDVTNTNAYAQHRPRKKLLIVRGSQ